MRLTVLLLAAGLLWSGFAFSQQLTAPVVSFKTGNQLYEDCTAPLENPRNTICTAYVMGMVDALTHAREICPSRGVTGGQLADIVTNYFRSHPEVRHLSAASEAELALQRAFPCTR